MSLTPKQEAFAKAYVETGNASEAYRMSYDVSPETKTETVWNEASKLKGNPIVAARIFELQEQLNKRHEVTVDSLVKELEQARLQASQAEQTSSMVAATMGKAKLHGLLTDKQEITSPDESMKPTTIVLIPEPIPDDQSFH